MKNKMILLVATFFMQLCSNLAFADCEVSLSQPNVDYGQIKRNDIVNTQKQWSTLADRQIQLNVYCADSQRMALLFSGKTGEQQQAFIFGNNSRLIISASRATVDGKKVLLSHTASIGSFVPGGQKNEEVLIHPGQEIAPVSNGQIIAGKLLSLTLTLKPALNNKEINVQDKRTVESNIRVRVDAE